METELKTIAFHITDNCAAHCPFCYENACKKDDLNGEIETLKQIAYNAIVNGHVESFLLVGGDPCEHPQIMELMRYIKEVGEQHGVKTFIEVLSNTHEYKEDGKIVPMEEVAKYVDKMNVTVHAETPEAHDAFNGVKGSYEKMMANVNEFLKIKSDSQSVGITVNVMPSTVNNISQIIYNANAVLGGMIEDICVQRIAPVGRALGQTRYILQGDDVDKIMIALDTLYKDGIGIEICDCFPYCSVKPEFRYLLPEGGCIWGTEFLSVDRFGNITRCALSQEKLSKNFLEIDSEEKFLDFWNNDPILNAFKKQLHLNEACKACEHARECGGGCLMARPNGDPFKNGKVSNEETDYLAKQ